MSLFVSFSEFASFSCRCVLSVWMFQGEGRGVVLFLRPVHTKPVPWAFQISGAHQFISTTVEWQTCKCPFQSANSEIQGNPLNVSSSKYSFCVLIALKSLYFDYFVKVTTACLILSFPIFSFPEFKPHLRLSVMPFKIIRFTILQANYHESTFESCPQWILLFFSTLGCNFSFTCGWVPESGQRS